MLPLPDPGIRCRHLSPQIEEWLADPERTPDEASAFWAATAHLQRGEWEQVGLASSFVFTGYYHARTATGQYILLKVGMLPPLPAVFLVYVGNADEIAGWQPPEERIPYWKRNPPPPAG